MKYIGIIKAHHVEDANFVLDQSSTYISCRDAEFIIDYVKTKGRPFLVTMMTVESLITSETIDGLAFYTDGFWIWPSYFAHYLEMKAVEIPNDFLSYVKLQLNKNEQPNIGPEALSNAIAHHGRRFASYIRDL